MGRGASCVLGSSLVTGCGVHTSENAGMSSDRRVRIPSADYLRVPGSSLSSLGESGPKARPTGVVDGQPVDILVPAKQRPC